MLCLLFLLSVVISLSYLSCTSQNFVLGLAPCPSTLWLDRYLWNENSGGENLSPVLTSKKVQTESACHGSNATLELPLHGMKFISKVLGFMRMKPDGQSYQGYENTSME